MSVAAFAKLLLRNCAEVLLKNNTHLNQIPVGHDDDQAHNKR